MSFKIPPEWWSKRYVGGNGEVWFNINERPLPEPGDQVPAYMIQYEKSVTVDFKKREQMDAWCEKGVKEETINVSNVSGVRMRCISKPGFLDSKNMQWVFFSVAGDLYYMHDPGILASNESIFDQILSTFKFTD